MGNEIKPPTTPELGTSDPTTASPESQATAANDPQVNGETMPSMEQQLRQLELKAAEHYDAWLRAKAETDNMRKRADADIAQARKYAIESFSAELLAVKDALEAALGVQNTSLDNLRSGVELTLKQLKSVFEKFKIIEVNPLGEKFDPHRHQAITTVASDAAPNTVVSVMQKGYLLQDRVLRPAMVTVAKPKSEAGSADTDASSA